MRIKGIDVSEHNGELNWDAIQQSDIKFAIIRSSWGHFEEDKYFRKNVEQCERIQMPYGLYHYSYVSNTEEMQKEAESFVDICKTCKPLYPCFLDMEDADGWKESQGVSDATNIETCYYTCLELEKAGFYAGIYANLDWLTNRINDAKLDRFDTWVAQWASTNTYTKDYGMWQFTSSGSIPNVSGNMDLNYAYLDYPKIIQEKGLNGYTPNPEIPNMPKYSIGTPVTYTGLWTQSNGGTWYPKSELAIKEGVITKIIIGAQHPYLINDGIGWANDKVIDDEPSVPSGVK